MPTSAQRPSAPDIQADLEDAQEALVEERDAHRRTRRELQAANAVVAVLLPFPREMATRLNAMSALVHALTLYQGGTPGSPVNDLMHIIFIELQALRNLAEANSQAPRTEGTGLLDDNGNDINDAPGFPTNDDSEEE